MLWDADVYVGRIVSALKAKNMYDNTLIWYSGDNGGVGTGINYPLRGAYGRGVLMCRHRTRQLGPWARACDGLGMALQLVWLGPRHGAAGSPSKCPLRTLPSLLASGEKHSNWEGGFRVAAFVSGGFLPAALRGTHNDIVFHIVDWYPTFCALAGVEGTDDPPVAPLPVDPANVNKDIYGNESFPALDGTNIWPMVTEPTAFNQTSVSSAVVLVGPLRWRRERRSRPPGCRAAGRYSCKLRACSHSAGWRLGVASPRDCPVPATLAPAPT